MWIKASTIEFGSLCLFLLQPKIIFLLKAYIIRHMWLCHSKIYSWKDIKYGTVEGQRKIFVCQTFQIMKVSISYFMKHHCSSFWKVSVKYIQHIHRNMCQKCLFLNVICVYLHQINFSLPFVWCSQFTDRHLEPF